MFCPKVGEFLSEDEQTHLDGSGNIVTDKVLWALTDQQGTVHDTAKVNANGVTEVVDHIVYDSFGKVVSETDPSQGSLIGYAGLPLDKASGTIRSATRPYDPSTGQWTQPDLIDFLGRDPNRYRYCGNSPTNATDPSGLQSPLPPNNMPPSGISDTGWLPASAFKALGELSAQNRARLEKVFQVARTTTVFRFWSHRCHAWVGAVRDKIVALGKEYYDNDEYVITYVDWDITDKLGHGGLRILIKKTGHVYYLDIGTLGGIFDEVPASYGKGSGTFPLVPRQHIPFWPWEGG